MLRLLCVATTLASLSIATRALASEPSDEPPPSELQVERPRAHDDILLTAGAGFFGEARKLGGAVNLTALRQKSWLGYGATLEYGGTMFDYTSVTAAPMIGVFVDGPRSLRMGIAAVGGVHVYNGVERGFISSSDPGAHATTAFVGSRVFFGAELGGKARFHVGLQLSADDDLARVRNAYTFEESAFTTPHVSTATHTVGAFRFGAMLALGTAFDL